MNLTKLFASTGDGVFAMDANQRIVYWNQAAEEILGYSPDEVIGSRCYQLFPGHSPDCTPLCCQKCDIVKLVQQQKPVEAFKVIIRHKNGIGLLLDVSTLAVPGEETEGDAVVVHLFRLVREAPLQGQKLQIRLFGKVQVRRADGTYLHGKLWRQTKVRALLAYLAVHRNRPVYREELMEELWPEMTQDAARHNLYTTVYNLRRCLEPDLEKVTESCYILQEDYSYQLNGEIEHWLDIQAFEAGVKQAHRQADPTLAIRTYQSALALYRGEFLSYLGNTVNWHWQEQERLCELYLHAMEEYGCLLAKVQQDENAFKVFEQILLKDPCRESAGRQLMSLHWERGNRTAALAVYQRLTQALQADLGVVPESDTITMYRQIANAA
ncbi:MAG: BTAD domain-containing putative transcriptional regulator [Chloroflexota bacterium]